MNINNQEFIDKIRARLKLLLKVKDMSMAQVSKASGHGGSSLKEFMNGRKNNTNITTLLSWARVLDVPYTALIGEEHDVDMMFVDEDGSRVIFSAKVTETGEEYENLIIEGTTEKSLTHKAGVNLRFVRMALGQSIDDFAKVAIIHEELMTAYEAGEGMVPPLVVVRLCNAFGFTADDIYN